MNSCLKMPKTGPPLVIEEANSDTVRVVFRGDDRECRHCVACLQQQITRIKNRFRSREVESVTHLMPEKTHASRVIDDYDRVVVRENFWFVLL